MSKYRNLGQAIEVSLEPWGHERSYVTAFYNYDYDMGKYLITMYCIRKDLEGQLEAISPVTRQMEDGSVQYTQPLSGEKGTIRSNICRVIQHMCKTKIIEKYLPDGEDLPEYNEGGDISEECDQ